MVGAAQCGTASTATTNTIVVSGNTGSETVTIDLSGARSLRVRPLRDSGVSEIEFVIDLSTGAQDRVAVAGSAGADTVVIGAAGANVNGDDDVDATLAVSRSRRWAGVTAPTSSPVRENATTGAANLPGSDAQWR